jgi:hypothetical protein
VTETEQSPDRSLQPLLSRGGRARSLTLSAAWRSRCLLCSRNPLPSSPTNLDLVPCVPSFTLSLSQTDPRAEENVEPRDWIGLDEEQPGTRSRGRGWTRSCSGGAQAEACGPAAAELSNPRRPSFCAQGPSFIPATALSAPSRVAAKTVPRQAAKSIPPFALRLPKLLASAPPVCRLPSLGTPPRHFPRLGVGARFGAAYDRERSTIASLHA